VSECMYNMTVRSVATTKTKLRQIVGFLLLRFMDRLGRLGSLTWVKWPGGKSAGWGGSWGHGWRWGHVLNIKGRALIILYGPAKRPKKVEPLFKARSSLLFPSPDLGWGFLIPYFSLLPKQFMPNWHGILPKIWLTTLWLQW